MVPARGARAKRPSARRRSRSRRRSTTSAYQRASTCECELPASRMIARQTMSEARERRGSPASRERREVLRLAVAVLVAGVGGTRGDADREERQQRRDEVGAGVRGLREEPEAVRGEARAELERDQRRSCDAPRESAVRRCGVTARSVFRRAALERPDDDVLPPREMAERLAAQLDRRDRRRARSPPRPAGASQGA